MRTRRSLRSGNKLSEIMSDKEEITLEGQAVTEILKEVKRSKELAKDFGALAWQKHKKPLPNKRFLNNTLVSTLRHSYREERKHRDGSYKKYKQHMQNRHFYKHKKQVNEEEIEPEQPSENIDYGEFDAAKYAETCTELYIRDSHRKHSRIRQNFVEKQNDGSSSDDSFTVEDDEEKDGSCESFHATNERSRRHWSESGSTDNDQAFTSDSNSIYKRGARQTGHSVKPSGSGHRNDWNDFPKNRRNATQPRLRHDLAMFESESESDEEDEESGESDSESETKTEKTSKTQSRNRKRIPNDGKSLLEKLSQRSMYADIEEIKKGQNYVSNSDEEDFERNKVCGFEMKHSQRQHKNFSEKKPRIIPRKNTEDKRLHRSKFIEKRMEHLSDSEPQERVFHEPYKTSKLQRQRVYENSYYKRPQPYRYNMERRGYPTYRGRYHRQNIYPPMPLNPFYATFLMEQMKEFLMHHQDYRKRSRSRSRSRKSRKKRKHRHRHHSRSTSSESRSYSRSRSRSRRRSRDRSKSLSRSDSSRRKSRSKSHSRSRSRSRRRSRTWSKSSSRSKSRKRSRHRSRSRSRKRSERRSRSKSRSRSRGKSRSSSRSMSRGRTRSKSRRRTRSNSRDRSRGKSRNRSRSKTRNRSRSKSRNSSRSKSRGRSRSWSRSLQRNRPESDSRSRSRKRLKHSSKSWSRSSSTKSRGHEVEDENRIDDKRNSARNNSSAYNEHSRSPLIQKKQTDSQHNEIPRQKSGSDKNHHRKSSQRIKVKHNSSHRSKIQESKNSSLKSENDLVQLKQSSRIDDDKIHSNSDGEVIEETDSKVISADNSRKERDVNELQEKNECLLKLKSRKSKKTNKSIIDIGNTSEVDNVEEKTFSDRIVCGEDEVDKSDTDLSGLESLTPEENNTDGET